MVTITNGIKTFDVTAGSVNTFKGMGFRVVSGKRQEEKVQKRHTNYVKDEEQDVDSGESANDVEESEEESFINELLEKPISQWSNDEVKEFVRVKGIDTSGVQKVSQVRNIIKSYLEEEQRNA